MTAYDREIARQIGVSMSHTLDAVTVTATRTHLINPLRADGHGRWFVAEVAAEHLAEQVAANRREVEDAVRGLGPKWDEYADPDYDPTDAELERAWNGPDAPEAHRAAWVLHQEMRSR